MNCDLEYLNSLTLYYCTYTIGNEIISEEKINRVISISSNNRYLLCEVNHKLINIEIDDINIKL